MTPRPLPLDEIPRVLGVGIAQTRGSSAPVKAWRCRLGLHEWEDQRNALGIGIPERAYSSHLSRGLAERSARRFVKGPKRDGEVIERFGGDEDAADRAALRAIMDRKP